MDQEAATPKPTLASFWTDLPREGRLLLSVVVFEFIGSGLVLPFWVVYLHEVRGYSLSLTGALLGVQPLVGMLAAAPGGALIDRFGGRRALIVSLVCVMAGELVMAVASTPLIAVVGLGLSGLAFGVSWPAFQTMIAHVIPTEIRQRYFGVNFSLLNLGIGIGGIVGGAFLDVHRLWTFQAIYVADAISFTPSLFLMLVPLRHVTGRVEHDPDDDRGRGSYREVLRQKAVPTMFLVTFVSSFFAYPQLNSGVPAFATAISHVSTHTLGISFACNTVVIVLLQLVVLQRIEGRRRTRVIAVMCGIWAIAWVCLGLSGIARGTWGASVLVAACCSVFALGETLLQPTAPAMTNDLTTDRLRGRTNALSSIFFQLPMVIAPPISGWLIGHHHGTTYVVGLIAGCGLTAVLALTRLEPQLSRRANGLPELEPADLVVPPVAGTP